MKNSDPRHAKLSELDRVYNPALGAFLIWRVSQGHFAESSLGLPLPAAFVILPIALHAQSRRALESTFPSSGLSLFAAKLGNQQEDLLAVHERALALRSLSLASLSAGVMSKMLYLDPDAAKILPLDPALPKPPPDIMKLGKACEKLGEWFARMPLEQLATTLRIAF